MCFYFEEDKTAEGQLKQQEKLQKQREKIRRKQARIQKKEEKARRKEKIRRAMTEGTVEYALKHNYPYDKILEFGGFDYVLEVLDHYVLENSTGRRQIEQGIKNVGPLAYPLVQSYTLVVVDSYIQFTSTIDLIDYGTEAGRHTAGLVEGFTECLTDLIYFLSQIPTKFTANILADFYADILKKVYSDPEGGFNDIFNAVRIRGKIVDALGHLLFEPEDSDYKRLLEMALKDPAPSVRRRAIKILDRQSGE